MLIAEAGMFLKVLTFILAAVFLTACGLRGPLYMPKDEGSADLKSVAAEVSPDAEDAAGAVREADASGTDNKSDSGDAASGEKQ